MEKEVFFVIEEKKLFLDKVLVEVNGMPLFFVCKNNDQYYIAQYIGEDEEQYIVSQISLYNLFRMLHGKIPMRDLMLQAKQYWEVTAGETADQDIVLRKDIKEIPLDVLPYEGACFKIATKDLQEYVDEIDSLICCFGEWESLSVKIIDDYVDICRQFLIDELNIAVQNVYKSVLGKGLKSNLIVNDYWECDTVRHNSKNIKRENSQIKLSSSQINDSFILVAA